MKLRGFPKGTKIKAALTASLVGAFALTANAAITLTHEYKMGEPGTITGPSLFPVDSVGTEDFSGHFGGGINTSVVATGGYDGGAFMRSSGGAGYYGGGATTPQITQTDNFAVGLYARASSLPSSAIFMTGGGGGSLDIGSGPDGWAASQNGVDWIGGVNGVDNSFTANVWTHLALVVRDGEATFFIDGVAQGSSYTVSNPIDDGGNHLLTGNGGNGTFAGDLDHVRIVTFDPVADADADIVNTLAIPEPSSTALLGLGGLALLLRRRK